MIKDGNIETLEIQQVCNICSKERTITLELYSLQKMEFINEYQNYNLPECSCGTVEVLNMNLPEEEEDIKPLMTEEEWQVRNFIKAFIQACKDLSPPSPGSEQLSWDDILEYLE